MKLRIASLIIIAMTTIAVPASAAKVTNPGLPYPIDLISRSLADGFSCRLWRESRSTWHHMNPRDNNRYGSSGILQIEPSTWDVYAPRIGIHVPVWAATVRQQLLVGLAIYRNDGWSPWRFDGC